MPTASSIVDCEDAVGEFEDAAEGVTSESAAGAAALALHSQHRGLKRLGVPLMLVASSTVMALAWLGHLRFTDWPFAQAMFLCWLLVLPEYLLNISAIRLGYHVYSGAQMAAFRLCSGVVCVALVSAWVLGETLTGRQLFGFALMVVAMGLISVRQHDRFVDEEQQAVDEEEAAAMAIRASLHRRETPQRGP